MARLTERWRPSDKRLREMRYVVPNAGELGSMRRELLAARRALRRLHGRVTLAVLAKTVAGPVGYELLKMVTKAIGPRKGAR